jgi:hypothetical protein
MISLKIVSLKKAFSVFVITFALFSFNGYGANITAIANGSWVNTGTWNLGREPASGDNILIPAGRIVNIPLGTGINLTGPEVTTITILGTLDFILSDITIDNGDGDKVIIGANGTIDPLGAFYFDTRFNLSTVVFVTGSITGPATIENGALPIELISFEGYEMDGVVILEWSTASEENNDYYSIERSSDGVNYELISTMPGAGNSTSVLEYTYIDSSPFLGRSYYRLRQTDFDGASETFNPITVDFTTLVEGKLIIGPNPVKRGEKITIKTQTNSDEILNISVYNMLGEVVLSNNFSGTIFEFNLDQNTRPGIYFVEVSSVKSQKRGRLLVQ